MIIITLILGWFSFKTSFDDDISHINYMTPQQHKDMQMLTNSLQTKNKVSMFAVSSGKDIQMALQSNEQLQTQLEKVRKDKKCEVSGVSNFLPSINKQKLLINKWNEFWAKHKDKVLLEISKESRIQGFSNTAFEPFSDLLSQNYKPQSIEYFAPIVQCVGKNYIIKDKKDVYVSNILQVPKEEQNDVKQYLRDKEKNSSYIFDSSDIGNQLVNILSDNFNYIGYTCSFIVFFFLWLSFGRIELSLISFLPLAVSWLWILGIMQLTSIQFNIVNIILATFIFGQGDDYTIFITDGLMYEYAYKKKMLASYKNSVALSALLMFIGIGTLIFAKHPAMRSLAEVTIIGMFTVVLMAFYFPPLLFKWITTKKGKIRQVPITFKRLAYSLLALLFFLFGSLFLTIFSLFYFNKTKKEKNKTKKEENRTELFHTMLNRVAYFIVNHIPEVKFSYINKSKEDFLKPSVIISNHQSHLDLMCLMMLTPKLVILTNNWVWKNPFYGLIIRYAEFAPITDGIENNVEYLKDIVSRGYSVVVFPEGTRSEDCSILRFHRGAFYLAQKLNLDIVPVFIHGVGHVLPKNDFMLRQGNIYVEVEKRISMTNDNDNNDDFKQKTKSIHQYYVNHYKEICQEKEKTDYFIPYVRYKYMYKGREVESNCKKILKQKDVLKSYIDKDYSNISKVLIINSGQGEFAWLFALVNKEIEVFAFSNNEEEYLLANNCSNIPNNLHFSYLDNMEKDMYDEVKGFDICFALLDKELDINKYEKYNPIKVNLL
jgi:1-acyl-sn-glycerol-3-phosphate acyltransferase